MKHLDLFSGIGGFALGLQWAGGFETVAFCEINEFCQKVLAMNFPDKPIFGDVKDVTKRTLSARGIGAVDLITAGFPCQPFSKAGQRKGIKDERFLWEELYAVIADVKPRYVLLENSDELIRADHGLIIAGILFDLASLGFAVEWGIIPALAVGAPHLRERTWIIAYPDKVSTSNGRQSATLHHQNGNCENKSQKRQIQQHGVAGLCADVPNPASQRLQGSRWEFWEGMGQRFATSAKRNRETVWNTEPDVCRVANGVSRGMDRLGSLGNAVVPQLVQMLGQRLIAFDKELNEAI